VVFDRQTMFVAIPDQQAAIAQAQHQYAAAARRRLGVLLAVAGRLRDGGFIAHVSSPASAEEAVNHMYPDGLKLSILSPLHEARSIVRCRLAVLRLATARRRDGPIETGLLS